MEKSTDALVLYADRAPIPGVVNPGPHQVYRNPRLQVESRALGRLHPDEIRVAMIYAGVCGTDAHLVAAHPQTGYIRSSAPARIPPEGRIIGHEGVGRVLAVGSRVRHVRPGAIVTFESIIVCHYCDVCRRGQFNQCRRARLLGLEKDGLFGNLVDVPSMLTHDVTDLADDDAGLRAAACVEPAGVAYVGCQNTHMSPGDRVVVFGGGPIGLFAAMLGKRVFGASRVLMVEPTPFRREFAKDWCDEAYDVEPFFDNPPRSVDVVIEASGDVSNVQRLFHRLNANARVALLARSGEPLTLDAVDHMITNQVALVGSRGHLCGAFAAVLDLYRYDRLPLQCMVTRVVDGIHGLCDTLRHPDRIFMEQSKVLAKLDGLA